MSEQNTRHHEQSEGREIRGTLVVTPDRAYVGDTVEISGRNLPPEDSFDLVWHSVDGEWAILEANEVVGPQYHPREEHVTTVTTDDRGSFDWEWEVPEDYGGEHTIELRTASGQTVTETALHISPWFEIDKTSATLGERFTIQGYGLGPEKFRSNYQLSWDNGTVGFMTGIQNRGTAVATVTAVGPPGKHHLQVWRNYRGVPFMQNNTQSPFGEVADGRESEWIVEGTEPQTEPETAWLDPLEEEQPLPIHVPEPDDPGEATLDMTPACGPPGTSAVISGDAFPPETAVDLVWHTHEGHRPKGIEITPEPRPDALPVVETDAEGSFRTEVTVPTDRGATRPIAAEVDGRSVATTGFMMQPKIETFSPQRGPIGTEIEIELSGVGWPMYENAYYVVYDNKPLGYICGLEAEVNRFLLRATGEPGYHCIDLYPSLFKVREDEPNFELIPHLSYLTNHPVRPLSAAHLTFEITDA